ncbi:MAG: transporter [Cyclobacteriaceae bacterium]
MKRILLLSILLVSMSQYAFSQGCIAIKNMSCGISSLDNTPKTWQFTANYRYFRSYRHFSGTEEHPDRVSNNTEVINNDNSLIIGGTYTINHRWTVSASVPFLYIDRSSLYEHDRINRYHSSSHGLGDIRLMGYYSSRLFSGKSSVMYGLGFKLPTGNYNFKDDFHTVNGIERRPVDQSIQPGDGGLGVVTEINLAHHLSEQWALYANALYMFNSRNTNGTRTFRETLSPILANEAIMSVPDQYMVRMGAQFSVKGKLGLSLGGRIEGIPVRDAIGKSDGFRRPGYIISVEPGITYQYGPHSFNVNVPFALVRNRQQSVTDRETELATGNPRHGDAAFADYLLSLTYAFKLSKKVF